MDCKDFQELLIQFPYNELNKEETILLRNHLENCKNCSAELKRNEELSDITIKLRSYVPQDHEKKENIHSILSEVKSSKKPHSRNSENFRLFRIIVNTAAVFLIGLFIFQQIEINRSLEQLNRKVESQNKNESGDDLYKGIKVGNWISNSSALKNYELSEDEVSELVRNYRLMQREQSIILQYLKENYPDVYNELLKNHLENTNPPHNL
jgi:hypothetical protein